MSGFRATTPPMQRPTLRDEIGGMMPPPYSHGSQNQPIVRATSADFPECDSEGESESESDEGPSDVDAPTWFEGEPFTTLTNNSRMRRGIYVLLSLAPVLTSAGSIMEVVHGCPTISTPIEGLFALSMMSFSGVWVFLFYSLCHVVRGADKNPDLMHKTSREGSDGEGQASKDTTNPKKTEREYQQLVDQFHQRYVGRNESFASPEGKDPNPQPADPEDTAASEMQPLARGSTAASGDQEDEKDCFGRYPIEKTSCTNAINDGGGPFTTLAFDASKTDHGLARVKITRQRYNKFMKYSTAFCLYGFLLGVAAVGITIGTLELMLINFDTDNYDVSVVAHASQELFFLEPGCGNSGFNTLYGYLLLVIWTPSCFAGALVWPAWLCSLQLGSLLAVDDVEDYIRELDPRKVVKRYTQDPERRNARRWRRNVEIPGGNLVVTMDQLSEWGMGMGIALVLCCGFSLGLIPSAVAYKSVLMVSVCILYAFLPIFILLAPAQVSSVCDDMLDQLNDISYLGGHEHKERCSAMRYNFTCLNRSQGLGFKMFSTVIDMRMLAKLGVMMATSSVGVITTLTAIGTGDKLTTNATHA